MSDNHLPFINSHPLDRRAFLRLGGGLSLSLGALPAARAESNVANLPGFGSAKSVIIVFASGGQSQFETWDPKPEAPELIRGEFSSIQSAVPDIRLSEHLPKMAQLADKYTIVRSMSHEDLDHGSAFYLSMTGNYHPNKTSNHPPQPFDLPCYSSILKRVRPESAFVQPAIHLNAPALVPELVGPGQFGGILGREYDPMFIGNVIAESIAMPGLSPIGELPEVRLNTRQSLLKTLEETNRFIDRHQRLTDMNEMYGQAFNLLADPKAQFAFDLGREPQAVRDRYGRNRAGQACLLARRLAEASVPLITVVFNHSNRGQDKFPTVTDEYGWDTHNDIFYALKTHLLPRFDLGFSALLEDLDERGLLESTLVICMGEFGRAPLVAVEKSFAGTSPGRKHWGNVYSIVMAGAGVSRGATLGRSDNRGAYPASEQFGPWDVTATIFSALGIDPAGHYSDPFDQMRPISIGKPMTALYAG
ncbi:MAG: DUF1501 domain-containing protein [Planctomycetota bacterium]|nr:DUF1501 domain-containing protein [Planctomycetota bacterium]MDA1213814.1 DUF1501 domain-containing protein [Planctomycetota bacterium]